MGQDSTALEDQPPLKPLPISTEPGMATLETDEEKDKLFAEIYGFVQTDAGYNAGRINPDWFDVVRPSQLPSYENEYGEDGDTFFSVRQSRFGIKAFMPTGAGNIRGIFEWELFGVGVDAGQTTIRLRHAYGQYKRFGAGQYWSPFMDIDVFPNSLEYWGPTGMAFYRNVQIRYMPMMGKNHISIALERPGGSSDGGTYNDFLQDRGIKAKFPFPDLSAEYRHTGDWGYFEIAGILRRMEWDDVEGDGVANLSGEGTGWGLNLSTNLKVGPGTIRAAVLYGEGIENYMNDSTADIAIVGDPDNPGFPLAGQLIPVWGTTLFYDIDWSKKWTTAVGFSLLNLDYDGTAALPDTYTDGRYALVNLQYHPINRVMYGVELQYGGRKNFSDGWDYDAYRIQFSFRYKYSIRIGGGR
jgi:hypothetical protein